MATTAVPTELSMARALAPELVDRPDDGKPPPRRRATDTLHGHQGAPIPQTPRSDVSLDGVTQSPQQTQRPITPLRPKRACPWQARHRALQRVLWPIAPRGVRWRLA